MTGDLIGQQLGPFRITEFLGSDATVEAYKGAHAELGQQVLIKLVHREDEADVVFNARFRREAKAIARLRHPNAARVYDFGETDDGYYVISRYIEGEPLADLTAEINADGQALSISDASFLIRQIAAALEEAQKQGVSHRCVTPENILVTRSGQAILTDFGLALLVNGSGDTPGATCGAPEYMAPEVYADARAASPAADIYSLGVIAYELLTAQRPYDFQSDIDIALRDLADTAPDARLVKPDLPEHAARALQRALSTSPKERFDSAMDFANALEYGERKGAAPPAAAPVSAAERIATTSGLTGRAARREKRRLRKQHERIQQEELDRLHAGRRRPLSLSRIIVVIVALLLVGGASAFLLQMVGVVDLPFGPEPVRIAASEPTLAPTLDATQEPTSSLPPTPTVVPSATPLQPAEATPVAALAYAPLGAGSSGFRLVDGMELRFVPSGTFLMGTDDPYRQTDARPQHPVMLGDYWLDRTEVTNAQYALCVEDGVCAEPVTRRYYDSGNYASHPVTYVQHTQAVTYCLWLARQSGEPIGLPTEAQWEKAAAWDPTIEAARSFPWGDDDPNPDLLRYGSSGTGGTAPVGTYPEGASAYGVLDMAGNVWEWVADWYEQGAYNVTGIPIDPTGPTTGTTRVTRGGGWLNEEPLIVSNVRNWASPTAAGDDLGFRCAVNTRRPVAGGIYLTPLDLTRALQSAVEAADLSTSVTGEWSEALAQLEAALSSGDNSTAQAIVDDRLVEVTKQRSSEDLPEGLALRLDNALLWMQSQLEGGEA